MRKDISSWKIAHSESRGVNTKEWVEDPEEGVEALFKETQIKDNSESTYADFAESIVSDICSLLGVPCARIELVERNGKKGCISYYFCNSELHEELSDIGSVIQNKRPQFQTKSMLDPEKKEAYCVEMILDGLESVSKNKTNFAELRKAFLADLLTDSLIDHYDRNPSNLSIIRAFNNVRLSPKYDNGTALSISVPEEVLSDYLATYPDQESLHKKVRENVLSKIGYLGRKFVKYPDLETFLFNYYYDDVKGFVSVIQEKLTDENIDKILSQEKYDELDCIHKEIIRGKLITNRNSLLERFKTISKKQTIDKIIYSKKARENFSDHVKKGTIQEILPEYAACIGLEDTDPDYDYTLDTQVSEKIQAIVDITQLARYFEIPLENFEKREKSLLKWLIIIENIQKANKDKNVFANITTRLGFLEEDKKLISSIIKDKFKDENDVFEAREIIYGEQGIGEENVNLYLAKKFVDAANMRKDIRDQRMEELRIFARTMKEAIELEHIAEEKVPLKTRTLQRKGITDKRQILEIKFAVARAYRENPRLTNNELYKIGDTIASEQLKGTKEEIREGVFVDIKEAEEIRNHTITLKNGEKLVLFDKNTKLSDTAFRMNVDYFGQIAEHQSGNGVTLNLVSKKGKKFPKAVSEYAKGIIAKYSKPDYPKGSFVFREPEGDKRSSCFIVTSIKNSNAKIPDITVPEMFKKLEDLFNEQERDKSHFEE